MAEDAGHGDDPFAIFLKPPENETPTERATREAREAEAKKRSDEIDEELKKEKELMRTRRKGMEVVLIGDSESGASYVFTPMFSIPQTTSPCRKAEFGRA